MSDDRLRNQLRPIQFQRPLTHAEGSVLVCLGKTQVLCNASVERKVPRFLKDSNQGWVTAEYGMLPRSTYERMPREAVFGKQSGRTQEIQRLIGRSLRAALDLTKMPEIAILVDCDVIQADGGTRTAAINGGMIALVDAIHYCQRRKWIIEDPLCHMVGAISVGISHGQAMLDLDYQNDCAADVDMNVVMADNGGFVEIQGTAEGRPFSSRELEELLTLAKKGIRKIIGLQRELLGIAQ